MTESAGVPVEQADEDQEPSKYGLNLLLFALTVVSVFWTGAAELDPTLADSLDPRRLLEIGRGWPFAVPLLAILIAHESGHYIAARIHRVPASLPFFIPLPKLSPFGTMGAIIGMSGRIRSRVALLDIGAAGPLAGMVVALPVLAFGLSRSPIGVNPEHYTQEGQSLLYSLMKRLFVGPIPDGCDVQLGPTAAAGWVGLLITMINMLPWGQLDGGHIAYALFGEQQNAFSAKVRYALFVFGGAMVGYGAWEARHAAQATPLMLASGSWLLWAVVLTVMSRVFGANHPPTEDDTFGPRRRVAAWACLVLFVLLFMPRWLVPSV